jgi:DNA-binding NtrC family response regulator
MAKILVLDDEKDACDLIERVLSSSHQVTTFTEEDSALSYVLQNEVDLAILDIKLKKMSGVDVLSSMLKIHPGMKAIMLTGYPTVQTAKESIGLGARDYLTKPLDIDQLEEKVQQALSPREETRKRKRRELAEDSSPSE